MNSFSVLAKQSILAFLWVVFLGGTTCSAQRVRLYIDTLQSKDGRDTWIGYGLSDNLRSDLEIFQRALVLPDQGLAADGINRRNNYESQIGMARLLNAEFILTGDYIVEGEDILINARLTQATGGDSKLFSVAGRTKDSSVMQNQLAVKLQATATELGFDFGPSKYKPIVEDPGYAAYEYYSKALEAERRQPFQSLTFLKKALANNQEYTRALLSAGRLTGGTLDSNEEALEFLTGARVLLENRKQTETVAYASSLDLIGLAYANKADFDKAEESGGAAIKKLQGFQMTDSDPYGTALANMARTLKLKGDLEQAMLYYRRALELGERLGMQNLAQHGTVLAEIGSILDDQERPEAADYFMRAEAIYDRLGQNDTPNYSVLMMNRGNNFLRNDQSQEALRYYHRALAIREELKLNTTAEYAHILGNIGLAHATAGDLATAKQYYGKDRQILDKLNRQQTLGYAWLLTQIGWVLDKGDRRKAASTCYLEAHRIYKKTGINKTQAEQALAEALKLAQGVVSTEPCD